MITPCGTVNLSVTKHLKVTVIFPFMTTGVYTSKRSSNLEIKDKINQVEVIKNESSGKSWVNGCKGR